ncbi:hypothetical protein GBAR_LOCUS22043 [Geodia barretti]|uniref:Uncharacterized protein n=1 Tax=Geodia barretti TaxID=519541 RepID=A0AA35X6J6_GEOBA|nr:hypothetical protein GBAR_LOCUS22043 [Geodia barretti]
MASTITSSVHNNLPSAWLPGIFWNGPACTGTATARCGSQSTRPRLPARTSCWSSTCKAPNNCAALASTRCTSSCYRPRGRRWKSGWRGASPAPKQRAQGWQSPGRKAPSTRRMTTC